MYYAHALAQHMHDLLLHLGSNYFLRIVPPRGLQQVRLRLLCKGPPTSMNSNMCQFIRHEWECSHFVTRRRACAQQLKPHARKKCEFLRSIPPSNGQLGTRTFVSVKYGGKYCGMECAQAKLDRDTRKMIIIMERFKIPPTFSDQGWPWAGEIEWKIEKSSIGEQMTKVERKIWISSFTNYYNTAREPVNTLLSGSSAEDLADTNPAWDVYYEYKGTDGHLKTQEPIPPKRQTRNERMKIESKVPSAPSPPPGSIPLEVAKPPEPSRKPRPPRKSRAARQAPKPETSNSTEPPRREESPDDAESANDTIDVIQRYPIAPILDHSIRRDVPQIWTSSGMDTLQAWTYPINLSRPVPLLDYSVFSPSIGGGRIT